MVDCQFCMCCSFFCNLHMENKISKNAVALSKVSLMWLCKWTLLFIVEDYFRNQNKMECILYPFRVGPPMKEQADGEICRAITPRSVSTIKDTFMQKYNTSLNTGLSGVPSLLTLAAMLSGCLSPVWLDARLLLHLSYANSSSLPCFSLMYWNCHAWLNGRYDSTNDVLTTFLQNKSSQLLGISRRNEG